MKKLVLVLMLLPALSFCQKKSAKSVVKPTIQKETKANEPINPITQFKEVINKVEDNFKKNTGVFVYQDFPSSPSGFIYYKYHFEIVETSYDIQNTNSLVSPYTGFIVVKLKVKSNASSGDVKSDNTIYGFSNADKAKENNTYESCVDRCIGDIKIIYAYQENKWVYKSIDTEISNKIENGSIRYDILKQNILYELVNLLQPIK